MSNLSIFESLHQGNEVLVIGNVWDAHSAQLAEKAGFSALGSSSHAIANLLGLEDGQEISVEEILFMVKHIVNAVKIPVSVDFEAGYSDDPEQVADYVKQLTDIGVVGINLEDGVVIDGKRTLQDAEVLVRKIKAIKAKTSIFINARADTYTTKHESALDESIRRAKLYQEAGADGIFIPLIETDEDIHRFVAAVDAPLNVFATPNLSPVDQLKALGVRRISYGAKAYEKVVEKTESLFSGISKQQRFSDIL